MKPTILVIAAAAIAVFGQSAQAREHHFRHHHHRLMSRDVAGPRLGWTPGDSFAWQSQPSLMPSVVGATAPQVEAYPQRTAYRGRGNGRPAAGCGWGMRE